MEYRLVHDAAKVPFPWGTILFPGFVLATGLSLMVRCIQQEQGKNLLTLIVSCSVFLYFVLRNTREAVDRHYQLMEWERTEDYSVVEGVVADFDPMPGGSRHRERFTVNEVRFEYPTQYRGGFDKIAFSGGPIRNGLQVRIAHREGLILRLEIQR